MTTTTEEAERLATEYGGFWGLRDVAAALRALAAERDALQAEKVNLQDDLSSAERERAHQHGRADRNAAEYAREQGKREALQKRVAELEEALDAASSVLHKAGQQFLEYEKQHAAKGTAVSDLKAAANKQWANRCFSAYWRAVYGGEDE